MQLNLSQSYVSFRHSLLNTNSEKKKKKVVHFRNYRQDCEQAYNQQDIKYLISSSIYEPVMSLSYI